MNVNHQGQPNSAATGSLLLPPRQEMEYLCAGEKHNVARIIICMLIYGRDRKSTRLNSSHQIISYAVFCLKKKKFQAAAPDGSVFKYEVWTFPCRNEALGI